MVDLFAGCGGLSCGLEQAGFTPWFVNEIVETFCNTYKKNHALSDDHYYVGDINELNNHIDEYKEYLSDITLVCGGPPCQGFSMANRQRILDDPRNQLYKAYLTFLSYVRPKFFIMENVKGMANKIGEIKQNFKDFLGKVIFYLWNDVFKNNGFEGPIFKDTDGSELSFGKFYKSDTKGNAIVQKDKVELFLNNLGVEEFKDENNTPEQEEDEDGNVTSSPSTGRDYTKFSVNGNGRYAKNNLAAECVKKYIELNPTKSAEEILSDWLSLGNIVPHFVESKEQYEARTDNSKRSHEIPCAGTVIYVAHNGYGSNGKVLVLKEAVNQKNWGITIDQA